MSVFRWMLVPLAAAGAWTVSIAVGLTLHDGIERLCPADQFVSGLCVAPWFPFVERVVFCVSAGLAATLIVVACTLTAPHHRKRVAMGVFAVGAVVALVMAFASDAYLEFLAAVSAGLGTCAWFGRRDYSRADYSRA